MVLPNIIEKTGRSEKVLDLPSKLLSERIVYFWGEINDDTMNVAIMQMLWLAAQDSDTPIDLYISSGGGSVYYGLALKDVIYSLPCKVNTIGTGICASMGAYLLACGTGTRKVSENCRIMLHSVSSRTGGTIHDMKIDLEETLFLQNQLMIDIANFTKGKSTVDTIKTKTERDYWLSADDCIKLGIVDEKIKSKH